MTTLISEKPIWVAQLNEVIVGWIALEGNRVIGLYVDPSHICRGFGSRLLGTAEGELGASGAGEVILESSWNAEAFYLQRGYEPLAERPAGGARPMRKALLPA